MKTTFNEENERIRLKNREAEQKVFENMQSVLGNQTKSDGINAVLKFFNEKERVDEELSLSEQLKYINERLLIKTRYVELDDDWYRTSVIPMLAKTRDGRWIAVIPDSAGSCFYLDGGEKVKINSGNSKVFTKNAVYFYKNMKRGKITPRDLISFMFRCTSVKDRITVLITCAAAILAGTLLPWANSFIFSRIIPAGDIRGTAPAAALIFSAVLSAAVLRLLQSLILTNSMLRAGTYVQNSVFSRLMSLKPDFFKNIKSGELSRMIMEFSDVSKIVSVNSLGSFISMILSFVYLVQIYIYAPGLLGWVILVTVILGAVLVAEGIMRSEWLRNYSESLSKMSGFCYELFSGIEQIKLNGAETRILRLWSERYLDASLKEDKPFFLKYSDVFCKLLTVLLSAVIFILGARLSASDYIAFSAAYGAYISAIFGVSAVIGAISSFRSSFTLIKPMLEAECEEYGGDKVKPDSLKGEITVSDLRFRYDKDGPFVLNGLSVHIMPGESVGIIGASGCGKSTLIRLLLGFEEADEGSIYIDGFDLRELDLKAYRRKIGAVMQNTGLIAGDIYSNVTLTKPDARLDEVEAAIEAAGLSDDVAALPMGLHTPISQDNCTLSGGQRQRVLIARALISKPSVLIFDEATSALDNITQAKISESIAKISCTKIIVAHRLSTIENCDRILVLDKGRIVQEGSFEKLKNSDGLLQQFMKRQIV